MDDRAKQTSLTALNKIIGNIARSAVKLNETIHNAALMSAQHALDFGDTTPAASLVDALPMTHRRSLLIGWFQAFSPIEIGKDGKTNKMKGHLRGKAEERKDMWQLEAGKATPFYAMPDVKNEPDVPTFDTWANNVVAFIKRSKNVADKIEDEKSKAKALEILEHLAETAEKDGVKAKAA